MVRGTSLLSARSVVSPRSVTCGDVCRADPCTLRQLRHAQRELEAEPALVLWAELGVIGHLIGEPMPVPRSELLDALAQLDTRHRECTLSHAVDAAVAARTPAFATILSPGRLAVHVNNEIGDWVINDERGGAPEDCLRWCVADQLAVHDHRHLLFGADRPSALESAVGVGPDDALWVVRLEELLVEFLPLAWPGKQLIMPAGDGR